MESDRENARIDEMDRQIQIAELGFDPTGMSEPEVDVEYYHRREPLTEEEKLNFDPSKIPFNLPEQYHSRVLTSGLWSRDELGKAPTQYRILIGGGGETVPAVMTVKTNIDEKGRPYFDLGDLSRLNVPNVNFGTGMTPEEKWEADLPVKNPISTWDTQKQPGGLKTLKAVKSFIHELSEANPDHSFRGIADSPRHANLYNRFFGSTTPATQLTMPVIPTSLDERSRYTENRPAINMEFPSYNERQNESALDKLLKAKDVMFTSTVDAEEAFENPNSRLKDKTGVERADKFLNDLSPEMKAMDEDEEEEDKKEVRRKLPNVGMGISSRDSSTIPTHSHATSFNKSFVTDLVKWVTQELKKESDPYANYRLPNEDPSRPFQEGEQAWRKDKKKSPTTEDTVPNIPNPNDGMRNMGLAGGMEDSKPGGAGTPGKFDPWAANDAKIPDATEPTRGSKRKKGLEKVGVTVETPYQQGNNMQAMQKVSVGGGSPHILTMVQPRTGSEENPQYVEKKGEIDLTADAKEDDIVNANKERRKRDKEAEVSQEPPLAVAGAMAGQIDNPVQQLMLKTEFGINPDDALHRGGDLDKDRKIPIDDEDIENSKEVEKELYKMIQNSVNGWFTKRNKENE